jgi:outer membrane receptor for ferrienterochelin and colicins
MARRGGSGGPGLAWLGAGEIALAQAGATFGQASPSGNATYGREFFAAYPVNNAEDMLRLIPGVQAIIDEQNQQADQRGFGSGGARILLNGRRFPGKANEVGATLRRIAAQTVARVELISGQSEGIVVRSQGILVNVVLLEGASLAGSMAWELNARVQGAHTNVDGLLSYKGASGPLSYSLGVERVVTTTSPSANVFSEKTRAETFFYGDGSVQEARKARSTRRYGRWVETAGLTYDFRGGARMEFNGYHEGREANNKDPAVFTRYSVTGAPTLSGVDYHESATVPGEVSEVAAEYGGGLGHGTVQALVIVRRERRNTIDFRNLDTSAGLRELNRTYGDVDSGEDIARAAYSLPLFQGQSIEFGAEAARNTLRSALQAFFDRDADGLLDPTPVQVANVEEKRVELFVTHRWTMTPRLSLESALNYETSRLTSIYRAAGQTSVTPKRSLAFFKPRFDLRYRAGAQVKYRLRVERTISQLQFSNFVPSLNFENNVIVEGNPFLQPEKTWTVEAGYERRLPRDAGLLEARIFGNEITDAIDKAPLTLASGGVIAVEGNIAAARSYGVEVKVSVRLGFMRLPNSLLSIRYLLQNSQVHDPFTGETRRLADDRGYQFDVGYRQQIRRFGASFGLNYRDGGAFAYSTNLIGPNVLRQYLNTEPFLEVFAEKRLTGSTVLRTSAHNLLPVE